MGQEKIEPGSRRAPDTFRIRVLPNGPYAVYGRPPLHLQTIAVDTEGACREFRPGRSFATAPEPVHLCRCGHSANKPYCDGSHHTADWDPELRAPMERHLDGADITEGAEVALADNERYCVLARFCEPEGGAWELTERSAEEEARLQALREASLCPGGRLLAWDRREGPREIRYAPSIGLLEDPQLGVSGGLWVRGGIPVERSDGSRYEIRNRTVLCRCGQSRNKPYCDGAHVHARWKDGLEEQERLPVEAE